MNKINKPVMPVEKKEKKADRENAVWKYVRYINVFGFFNKDLLLSMMPFILFLMLVGILYIANSYQAERTIREIDKINKELKALRTDYIIGKSELMFLCNQSEVARLVEPHGLKEAVEAPVKIVMASNHKK